MNLTLLQPGQIAQIKAIKTDRGIEQRLQTLGFGSGREITLIRRIGTTEAIVRRREAEQIYLQEINYKGVIA